MGGQRFGVCGVGEAGGVLQGDAQEFYSFAGGSFDKGCSFCGDGVFGFDGVCLGREEIVAVECFERREVVDKGLCYGLCGGGNGAERCQCQSKGKIFHGFVLHKNVVGMQ